MYLEEVVEGGWCGGHREWYGVLGVRVRNGRKGWGFEFSHRKGVTGFNDESPNTGDTVRMPMDPFHYLMKGCVRYKGASGCAKDERDHLVLCLMSI
jgi:hypothetical protein|tara:strand:- start:344 stop:631 length:288 start_codon:yes stop_codon:yes gene_type:complete